jgi:hypothetical protein
MPTLSLTYVEPNIEVRFRDKNPKNARSSVDMESYVINIVFVDLISQTPPPPKYNMNEITWLAFLLRIREVQRSKPQTPPDKRPS